jgi:hypothetical protein
MHVCDHEVWSHISLAGQALEVFVFCDYLMCAIMWMLILVHLMNLRL